MTRTSTKKGESRTAFSWLSTALFQAEFMLIEPESYTESVSFRALGAANKSLKCLYTLWKLLDNAVNQLDQELASHRRTGVPLVLNDPATASLRSRRTLLAMQRETLASMIRVELCLNYPQDTLAICGTHEVPQLFQGWAVGTCEAQAISDQFQDA